MKWLRRFFLRRRGYEDLSISIQDHLEEKVEELMEEGMSREEAIQTARRAFGNVMLIEERSREEWQWQALESVWADVKYALRQLIRRRGFAVTAIVTLALGIGANVIVFSVLNTLILEPLNLPDAKRLFTVVQQEHGNDNQSYPDYLDYRARNSAFADVTAYRLTDAGLSVGGSAGRSWLYEVAGSYFDMLGVQPVLGRFFHMGDEHGPDSNPVIVLSDGFWRRRFHADPRVIGTTVEVNKYPFAIIGVAPPGFHGTELFLWPDFWIPMVNEKQIEGFDFLTRRGNHGLWILGKLKSGVTAQQAADNLNAIAGQLAKQYPNTDEGMRARLVKTGLMGDVLDATGGFLFGILLLSMLVLVAGCANLAGIFGVRAADRSRELGIRLAIGASRWRILRQLVAEAVLVALAGGLTGTLFATILLRSLTRWQPFREFPIHVTVTADLRVYGIALLLSIASGLFFGMLPARLVWQTDAVHAMKGMAAPVLVRRFTLRDLLLGLQIALCTLLVAASLVALRGMQRSLRAPIGFRPLGAMLASTDMHMAGHSSDASLALQHRMIDEALRIPGVSAAGTINETPLGTGGSSTSVYREGTAIFSASHTAFGAKYYSISPGYLQAAQTSLMAGRDFTWHDDANAPQIALVNETFARSLFGTANAVGRRFLTGPGSHYEIVGIVEDGKYESLTETPQPAMFFPLAQATDSDTTLVVRSTLSPADTAAVLNRLIAGIDPALPVSISSWTNSLNLVLFPARVAAAALGIIGLLAAMLAVTGTFGMAAYNVSRRMKELGIRIALGAARMDLVRSALARPLVLLFDGSLAGLMLGLLTSRFLAQIVYQATPRDPWVIGGVILTMILLGLLATWMPAWRALEIDPARLLRDE